MREWRAQDPPGRFLKQDEATKLWYEVGDEKAKQKTSQSLREKEGKSRKSSESSVPFVNADSLFSLSGNFPSWTANNVDDSLPSFPWTMNDVRREVELAVRSVLGIIVSEQDTTLMHAGVDQAALARLITIIRARFGIEVTTAIANDSISSLTKRVYAAFMQKSGAVPPPLPQINTKTPAFKTEDLPPLPPSSVKMTALTAAAQVVKSPEKEGTKNKFWQPQVGIVLMSRIH